MLLPRDFVRMFEIPLDSITARTPPPAMTPVPGEAGRMMTFAAPNSPTTSCGIVPSTSGTMISDRLAFCTALRIASGTSFAFPSPVPTCPLASPTTTTALKEKRRPPFTTLATRLM